MNEIECVIKFAINFCMCSTVYVYVIDVNENENMQTFYINVNLVLCLFLFFQIYCGIFYFWLTLMKRIRTVYTLYTDLIS